MCPSASSVPSSGQDSLMDTNTYHWVDQFQVFLTQSFHEGALISEATNSVEIRAGQSSHFKDNMLQPATAADPSIWDTGDGAGPNTSFGVGGIPNTLHAGIKQSTGNGRDSIIYVDPNVHIATGLIQLTPKSSYLCFWKMIHPNETIAHITPSEGFEWSFDPGQTTRTLRFGYEVPDSQSGNESPTWFQE
ncbi:hypothetical protein G7Z17_g4457 [Cylindrodendrum hubeiense]|uniref:Uncharacterized protein n=1 Tax=Cylindrodendrum hubeiense TaxID=595255 RepID=A0A9P5H8U8_9HYPO|nr:hypothetical protein G7Z17_g4457 [Cylindrodendrum hubeiense]